MIAEIVFAVDCKGRDAAGKEVLRDPAHVDLTVHSLHNGININVNCPYNTGAHGQRCKASHPRKDKVGEGVPCAYAVDLPMERVKF